MHTYLNMQNTYTHIHTCTPHTSAEISLCHFVHGLYHCPPLLKPLLFHLILPIRFLLPSPLLLPSLTGCSFADGGRLDGALCLEDGLGPGQHRHTFPHSTRGPVRYLLPCPLLPHHWTLSEQSNQPHHLIACLFIHCFYYSEIYGLYYMNEWNSIQEWSIKYGKGCYVITHN